MIPLSGTRTGDIASKARGKNPFLIEDEETDGEVKSVREDEVEVTNGLEGLTSTACFACDVATQTPLPAKPCCNIMCLDRG